MKTLGCVGLLLIFVFFSPNLHAQFNHPTLHVKFCNQSATEIYVVRTRAAPVSGIASVMGSSPWQTYGWTKIAANRCEDFYGSLMVEMYGFAFRDAEGVFGSFEPPVVHGTGYGRTVDVERLHYPVCVSLDAYNYTRESDAPLNCAAGSSILYASLSMAPETIHEGTDAGISYDIRIPAGQRAVALNLPVATHPAPVVTKSTAPNPSATPTAAQEAALQASYTQSLRPWIDLYTASATRHFDDLKGESQGLSGSRIWTPTRQPLLASCLIHETEGRIVCSLGIFTGASEALEAYGRHIRSLAEILPPAWKKAPVPAYLNGSISSASVSPDGRTVLAWIYHNASTGNYELLGAIASSAR